MTTIEGPTLDETAAIKWSQRYPELGTEPMPTENYYSPEYFEREKLVFRQAWLNVARVEEIASAGDCKAIDLDFLGLSILLTRAVDGSVHAVHNICSHRGNRLIAGTATMNVDDIACAYHGWRYSLDGEVDFIPDEESFFNLDRRCLALTPVHVDIWEGFIFINLSEQPQYTLPEYLSPLYHGLHGYPWADFSATGVKYVIEVPANWKLCRDAFIETYHVNYVHRRSLPNATYGQMNPNSHVLNMNLFELHSQYSPPSNPDYVPTLLESISRERRGGQLEFEFPSAMNSTRNPHWLQDGNMIFPNFIIDPSAGSLFGTYYSYHFWPITVDRTRMEHEVYFTNADNAAVRAAQEFGKVLQRDAWLEDVPVLTSQHKSVASGVKPTFNLQDQETMIRHANFVLDREIRRIEANG